MPKVVDSRMSAEMEGEFVVFLIGMRINKPWKLHRWIPVFLAMPELLKELEGHPESGFLGHNGFGRVIVQYWRSFEHLEAYARAKDKKHWTVWIDFNRRMSQPRRCRHLARDLHRQARPVRNRIQRHATLWPR
ncbi:MAG: DUF4188 domain-containing protein [Candidatus Sulfotelmatobacter sp.]